MTAVDISELVAASLEDRARCRVAGVAEIHPNAEVGAHVIALAARLKDRLGAEAAMRAAFTLWDVLEAGSGNSVH